MDDADGHEQELAGRQATGMYPIGRALRQTYDAENHDTLGQDLTGLMLELARVEPPLMVADEMPPIAIPPQLAPSSRKQPSWLQRFLQRWFPTLSGTR